MSKSRNSDPTGIVAEIDRIMRAPYTREILPNEDDSWFARVVEFPGCMTEGATKTQALENLDDAMREWLRTQLEDGAVIPVPISEVRYSGRLVVRMTSGLHRDLAEKAAREGVSLNSLICTILARAVGNVSPSSVLISYLIKNEAEVESTNAAAIGAAHSAAEYEKDFANYMLSERQARVTFDLEEVLAGASRS